MSTIQVSSYYFHTVGSMNSSTETVWCLLRSTKSVRL